MGVKRAFWVAGVVAGALAVPMPGGAQTGPPPQQIEGKSLEELMNTEIASVVGATRHAQPVTEAPSR